MGGPFGGLNKWEGVMSACGKMYCMPLNHKRVLEIDPVRGVDGERRRRRAGAAAERERGRAAGGGASETRGDEPRLTSERGLSENGAPEQTSFRSLLHYGGLCVTRTKVD